MKIMVPSKEIEVCDICGREQNGTIFTTCIVCGRRYCLLCKALLPGCIVSARVGKCCGKRDDVEKVIKRYADQIAPIVEKRTAALKRLPANYASTPTTKGGG